MFAVIANEEEAKKGTSVGQDLLFGVDYHSHLGTMYGGMAVIDGGLNHKAESIQNSQFKTAFLPDRHKLDGHMGIGAISALDEQPDNINPINKALGFFSIVTIGQVENFNELEGRIRAFISEPWKRDQDKNEVKSATRLIGLLVSSEKTIADGIKKVLLEVRGSISLLILTPDGIYAARSKRGQTSLTIGEKRGFWAITLETSAFHNLGYRIKRSLRAGEIILFTPKGYRTLTRGSKDERFCPFFPVYSSFPAATFGGISAEGYRELAGGILAQRDFDEEIILDAINGVPDSGVGYATGYAKFMRVIVQEAIRELILMNFGKTPLELADEVDGLMNRIVPFARLIVKYTPGWGRSYTPTEQEIRDLVASMKLVPIPDLFEGIDSLGLTEDSIVRGTQLRQYLAVLRRIVEDSWGLKMPEMHVRVGCPPLGWPCPYMLSTQTTEELIARQAVSDIEGSFPDDEQMRKYLDPHSPLYAQMVDRIAQKMGVQSISYLTLGDMISILGRNICTYCWTGRRAEEDWLPIAA